MKQHIEFDRSKYEINKYIKDALDGFGSVPNYILVIDRDFHVYAIDCNQKSIWLGDSAPYDLEWFHSLFSEDTGGKECKKQDHQSQIQ